MFIGTDIVDVDRFKKYKKTDIEQLKKIFTVSELEYCFANEVKSAERLAVRFACKEAAYKATCQMLNAQPNFLNFLKNTEVILHNNLPNLKMNWLKILGKNSDYKKYDAVKCTISLSHGKSQASAFIILNF